MIVRIGEGHSILLGQAKRDAPLYENTQPTALMHNDNYTAQDFTTEFLLASGIMYKIPA